MKEKDRQELRDMNQALNKWMIRTISKPLPTKHNKRQWRCKYNLDKTGNYICSICGKQRNKPFKLKGKLMTHLTDKQIRKDNPHFGPVIRTIEQRKYESKEFDFTYLKTVGARDSILDGIVPSDKIDAWATYLWSPSKNAWVLGAN